MEQLRITLFGYLRVKEGDKELTSFRTQKVLALLAMLAAERETAQRREVLMTRLWPGMPDSSARQNLRQVLYHLRQALPGVRRRSEEDGGESVPLVIANRQTIQLNPQADVAIDVAAFEDLLAQSQAHEHVDLFSCYTCYETLSSAVEQYQGDFLADFYLDDSNDFEAWAETMRQAYRRKVLDALETLTIIALRRQALPEARTYAERQLQLDDLRESAYRQLMEILARGGRRSEALAVYESYRRLLAEELGMMPAARTTELYETIRIGETHLDDRPAQGVRGYDLLEEIGAGAYGEIFRAIQPAIGREVAVKVIRRRFANDPQFIRRFETEAQTIARLEHPHIVPLYDYWREAEGAFLVMRLLRGGNLSDALADGPWDPERAQQLLDQIAAALNAAHRQGIVHRDIKPGNILFDEEGYAYLSDFGIAKDTAKSQQLMMESGLLGTADYVSPEQLQEGEVTPQTDIYSLGAVLYEVLSGKKPYPERQLMAVLQGHLSGSFPLLSSTRPDLSSEIDVVIQRATAREPADRYASVLEMAAAFRGVVIRDSAAETDSGRAKIVLSPADGEMINPYKGLRPYEEADAGEFYGREALVGELAARLERDRFLAVIGPSGSGKSSVVKAGLIPALRKGVIRGSDVWYVATMTPGTHPLEELELALWPIAVDPPLSLVEPMALDTRGMLRTIRRILPGEDDAQLLLIIDQFEELFTLAGEEQRSHFLDSLLEALADPGTPLRVVVTLRADFYDRPLQYEAVAELFKAHSELVLPLTREEVRQAIQEPARRAGVRFEEGVVTEITADAGGQPGSLPLMQYALTELFEQRQGAEMTVEAYREIGGVSGALGRRAEEIYRGLDAEEQEAARQLFLRLVTLGDGVEDTRRRALREELEAIPVQLAAGSDQPGRRSSVNDQQPVGKGEQFAVPNSKSQIAAVLDRFGQYRLLTFDRDPVTRGATVEVAHEALLREWPQLQEWLEESRADIRLQRLLATETAGWKKSGEDAGYLLRGARLDQYDGWLVKTSVSLTEEEKRFLAASFAARDARLGEEAVRRRRELETAQQLAETERQRAEEGETAARGLRRRALLLSGALVVAAVLAAAAFFAWRQAGRNATTAERSAQESQSLALASGARAALADDDTDQALMLALAANDVDDPPAAAREVLYEAVMTPGTKRRIDATAGWLWAMDVHAPSGRVAAGGDDAVITVWDIDSGEQQRVLSGEHSESIGDLVFLPDGERLLSGAYDDALVLWDLESGQAVRRMENPSGDVNLLDVSPDGTMAIAGTEGGVATLWDLDSGELLAELVHNPEVQVLPVAFAEDGRLVATGSEDGSVIIWDVGKREALQEIAVMDGVLFDVSFTPDGQTLAAGGQDNAVHLYDVQSGEELGALGGLADWLFNLDFSEDGAQLFGASRDGAVLLWDMATQQLLRTYIGKDGRTLDVHVVDDETVVSSTSSSTLRVWDLPDRRLQALYDVGDFLVSAAYRAEDGLVALGLNQSIQLLNAEGEIVAELAMPEGSDPVQNRGDVTALAFDPTGERLLAANDGGELILWDAVAGEEVRRFEGHESRIHDLAFSPDGRTVLSVADDQRLTLWEVETGDRLFSYQNPTDTINSVTFGPNGESFAAGMGTFRFAATEIDPEEIDNSIRVWDAASGEEIAHLEGHEGPVIALAFSPDGDRLLSGSLDATLRLWDVAGGEALQRFDGHTSGVMSLDFDDEGRFAVSGAQDGTVNIWEAAAGDLLRQITGHGGLVHTTLFMPDGLVLSAAEDGFVKSWDPALDEQQLLAWAHENRYIPEFSCEERARYEPEGSSACIPGASR